RATAPKAHEARARVVAWLSPRELAVDVGAVGVAQGEDLCLVGDVGPELGAAAEAMEHALHRRPVVEAGGAAGARAVEDRGGPVRVADAAHLGRDLVERLVPADALEATRPPRSHPAEGVAEPVGMVSPARRG